MTLAPTQVPQGGQILDIMHALSGKSPRDADLRNAIGTLLIELGADGLVWGGDAYGTYFPLFLPALGLRADQDRRIATEIVEIIKARIGQNPGPWTLQRDVPINGAQRADMVLYCIPVDIWEERNRKYTLMRNIGYFSFCGERGSQSNGRWKYFTECYENTNNIKQERRSAFEACNAVIQVAMDTRSRQDAAISPTLSLQYWDNADVGRRSGTNPRRRPWDADHNGSTEQLTASLSIDLRKSTFAMGHAINPRLYATWIEGLVLMIRDVVHHHCGVFDKFTGDGAIAHFPRSCLPDEPDLHRINTHLSRPALICGWEIVSIVTRYVDDMRDNLSLNIKSLGVSAGVAVDRAHWDIDQAGQPIVVGPAVVQACRASGGPAGLVYATNGVFQAVKHLYADIPDAYQEIDFSSKDYPDTTGVQIYKLDRPPTGLVRNIDELCRAMDPIREKLGFPNRW